jgi:ATP-binding cassette subfamily B protein
VPQKAVTFRGTVAGNIRYGDNGKAAATNEEVALAMKIAQGADFVEQMEGTYDADIAQGGSNLSGGQKQRLAIARAVARKPEIYIFDDSFSALDYKTDRALRTALKRETAGVTSLIVAQRIGTILDADRIIVLNEGAIVGIGTHKELLKSCEVYQEIAMSQLSEEELSA